MAPHVVPEPPAPDLRGESPAPGAGGDVTHYISLRQPWASLFVFGVKGIETRSWSTKFRGRLAVHASKTFGPVEVEVCYRDPFARELAKLGYNQPIDLPRGAVLGWVTIADCLEMGSVQEGECPFSINSFFGDPRLTAREREFGDYRPGRFAWITGEERRVLAAPLPMKALQRIQKLPPAIAKWLST